MGRRKVLFISQLGTLIAWGIFLLALYLPINTLFEVNSNSVGVFSITLPLVFLFIARALDGLTGGNVSVANAYLGFSGALSGGGLPGRLREQISLAVGENNE